MKQITSISTRKSIHVGWSSFSMQVVLPNITRWSNTSFRGMVQECGAATAGVSSEGGAGMWDGGSSASEKKHIPLWFTDVHGFAWSFLYIHSQVIYIDYSEACVSDVYLRGTSSRVALSQIVHDCPMLILATQQLQCRNITKALAERCDFNGALPYGDRRTFTVVTVCTEAEKKN